MECSEIAFTFECGENCLTGIASLPEHPAKRGVLIIVGGPQYRIGSHRQFTLLARDLARAGIPSMRFDYRGMGDSDGDLHTFENVHEDIRSAVDAFLERCPGLESVILWGLCDAASAAIFYARHDPRICGLVLLNPWIRTTAGEAKARLKHYYLSRLTNPALWQKLLSGKFHFRNSFRDLFKSASALTGPAPLGEKGDLLALPDRMRNDLGKFNGRILLILSGNDLTAREFDDATKASSSWRKLLGEPRVQRHDLIDADHTFSCRHWRDQVSAWTQEWISAQENVAPYCEI